MKPVIRPGTIPCGRLFPDDPSKKPRKRNRAFIDCVVGLVSLYSSEAQNGMGKTEAALYAYPSLVGEKATGIYFALPPANSNKIYDRFNAFLHQIAEY